MLRAFSSCKFPVQLEVIMALMVSDPQLYLCTACVAWDCCQCVSLRAWVAWRAWEACLESLGIQASQAALSGAHCMVYLLLRLFLHQ